MDAIDSMTLTDEDDDASNLRQTQHHDLTLQNMPPLVTDLNGSSNDDSSFASSSQDFSEDDMPANLHIGACNVTKLKSITPVEGCQLHPKYVN